MLTDVLTNSLKACIIFCLWLRQTSRLVLCAAHMLIARITRITPLQESYTATFSQMVSWTSMFVGRSTEDNEEEDFDDHFPGSAGFDAFDDDIPMEEPEVDVVEDDPSDDLG